VRDEHIPDAVPASTIPNKRKPVDPQKLQRRRAQSEHITKLARELIAAIHQRYGLEYIDAIYLDHFWIGAKCCDGSWIDFQQYETRELPQYRRGER
jgi:hypothetical protein